MSFPPGEMPATNTIRRIDAPPESSHPTSAQLKGDIDSGRTGDKVGAYDPGLSPLGTDDEAAGTSPEPHRVKLARQFERVRRWAKGSRPSGTSHDTPSQAGYLFLGLTAAIALVLLVGIAAT
ncbi:hypothetical protein [Enterovirga aerilata]|uniref:Uncharacterized protein n=1 Tax=Enterovirga aerilata TaxID=2730920 RepID=A0A849I9F7_9HYPH|nr:hypothetical protein [Enterovirga sp. DB1703]NNM73039.1 hypothetical protein [Enterovirga sp. DB1703]